MISEIDILGKELHMYTSYINYAPKGSIYLGQYKKLSDAWRACDEALELLKNEDVIYRPIIIGEQYNSTFMEV
jgi:hypothetical protein